MSTPFKRSQDSQEITSQNRGLKSGLDLFDAIERRHGNGQLLHRVFEIVVKLIFSSRPTIHRSRLPEREGRRYLSGPFPLQPGLHLDLSHCVDLGQAPDLKDYGFDPFVGACISVTVHEGRILSGSFQNIIHGPYL